jgi:hypothetical protein
MMQLDSKAEVYYTVTSKGCDVYNLVAVTDALKLHDVKCCMR